MASPTTPQHGRHGAIYRLKPNGLQGTGLNDVTWGTAFSDVDSAYFEVEIDAAGTPDTFQWRKNGGGWTTGVSITGASQTLSDAQTITFAATTGHTVGDKWYVGNLFAEPCTESGTTAQITDTTKQIINPNYPPTFTDDGGETVLRIDYTTGTAYFTANVGTVTVAGNLGYIEAGSLKKVGYLTDWSFNVSLDLADQSYMGEEWKNNLAGQGGGSGSASAFFIGSDSFFEGLENKELFFLQLFNYDPDQDQTGDHFNCWVYFTSDAINASVGDNVKESIDFTIDGIPSFTENT